MELSTRIEMRFTISLQFDSKIASSGLPSYQSLLQNGGKNLHRGGKSRRESRKIGTRKRRARLKQAVIRGIILPVHVCDAAQEHTRENDDVKSAFNPAYQQWVILRRRQAHARMRNSNSRVRNNAAKRRERRTKPQPCGPCCMPVAYSSSVFQRDAARGQEDHRSPSIQPRASKTQNGAVPRFAETVQPMFVARLTTCFQLHLIHYAHSV